MHHGAGGTAPPVIAIHDVYDEDGNGAPDNRAMAGLYDELPEAAAN
jgi:hypothetical protein